MTEQILDMLRNTDAATGADFSSHKGKWDINTAVQNNLLSALDFAILRGGFAGYGGSNALDTRLEHNYQQLLAFPNIERGVYWYPTIHVPWEDQRDFIISDVVADRKFNMIVVDIERTYNLMNGRIPGSFIAAMLRLLKHLDRHYGDEVKVMVYCDWYFMRDLLMPYSAEYTQFPWWIASYPYGSWKNPTSTLLNYLRQVFEARTKRPTLPPGYPAENAKIWQIVAGSMIGNEFGFDSDELDWNVSLSSKQEFEQWLGVKKGEEPGPGPDPNDPGEFGGYWDGYRNGVEAMYNRSLEDMDVAQVELISEANNK